MTQLLRRVERGDVSAMDRIRVSVKENRLTSRVLSDTDYLQAIERDGRGWVIEVDGHVLGFAIAKAVEGLWSQGARHLWLTTEAGTRAQRFYEDAGWRITDKAVNGELRYELPRW